MDIRSPSHSFFPLAVVICATPTSLVGLVGHPLDLSRVEMVAGSRNIPTSSVDCDSCHDSTGSIDLASYPKNGETVPAMV